jgi:hypothetical protein
MKSACRYFVGFIVLAIVGAARAEEGGAGRYAPGSFASFIDVLPGKPSLAAFNYFTYYNGSADVNRQFPIAGQIDSNVKRSRSEKRGPIRSFSKTQFRSGAVSLGVLFQSSVS